MSSAPSARGMRWPKNPLNNFRVLQHKGCSQLFTVYDPYSTDFDAGVLTVTVYSLEDNSMMHRWEVASRIYETWPPSLSLSRLYNPQSQSDVSTDTVTEALNQQSVSISKSLVRLMKVADIVVSNDGGECYWTTLWRGWRNNISNSTKPKVHADVDLAHRGRQDLNTVAGAMAAGVCFCPMACIPLNPGGPPAVHRRESQL
jgi:hypothetical protein